METCEPQTLEIFEDAQFSVQGFPASRHLLPRSDEARTMTVGSGRQCSMLLDASSPLGAFSKILLASRHFTSSTEYCYVWRVWDTRFDFSAFRLTPLALNTEENESSLWQTGPILWPTPRNEGFDAGCHNGKPDSLHAAAKLWPTPSAGNFNDGESLETWEARKEKNKAKGINGNGQGTPLGIAAKLWPTPTVRDWKSTSHGNQGNARPLSEVAGINGKILPTPTSSMASVGDFEQASFHSSKRPPYNSGSLNPRFVEELMGFPIDHTALKHSGTPVSRSKSTRFSKQSSES